MVDGRFQMAAAITNYSRCVLLRLADHWAPRVDEPDVVMLWPDVGCFFWFSARERSYSTGQFVLAVESSDHVTVMLRWTPSRTRLS